MGRGARIDDFRKCASCQEEVYGDAKDLRQHYLHCLRLKALGMTSPDLVRPRNQIILAGGAEGG